MSMDAWRYYKSRIEQLLQGIDYYLEPYPEVLKTDVFNEIRSLPGEGGVTRTTLPVTFVYVDNNQGFLDEFKTMYPAERAYLMDIRDLRFSPGRFTMVLDCSTIDHIPFGDVEDVVCGYWELLKPGGVLLLISWTADSPRVWPRGSPSPEQYYHPRSDLESILNEYFTILDVKDDIIPADKYGLLISYTLHKEA